MPPLMVKEDPAAEMSNPAALLDPFPTVVTVIVPALILNAVVCDEVVPSNLPETLSAPPSAVRLEPLVY